MANANPDGVATLPVAICVALAACVGSSTYQPSESSQPIEVVPLVRDSSDSTTSRSTADPGSSAAPSSTNATSSTTVGHPSTTATSTATATPESKDSDVSIGTIQFDGPGNDVEPGDSEYIELVNGGRAPVDLSGWSVTDAKDHTISIPGGFTIDAGGTFRIYTGPGTNQTSSRYYDGRGQAIWNNSGGDEATLRNSFGEVVDTYSYS